jgi:alginate O-acetyltransferase complex protein AlgI
MLFNSLDFGIFLPCIFIIYWFIFNKNLNFQNAIIVLASYFFYAWWDWRFLGLIIFSTIVDFQVGNLLNKEKNQLRRKFLLWTSVTVNLGFLGFFKYYNFFLESFTNAFSLFGMDLNSNTLNIILPVGISFYTFQTLSYTIDIYRKKLVATSNFVAFSAFVSFFPQLVAGPIERATNLLPQFYKSRKFDYVKAIDGMKQILWGLFKKIVIADNCGEFANQIFNNYAELDGSTLAIGVFFFSFQIYGDFSGYSDIAIGVSRLFGFNLKQNFATPYFSRNILEFWKRWHISLTSWLTDYIFTPLAIELRHLEKWGITIAIFITFFLSGLWHGANWTFIIWGLIHGFYYLFTILLIGHKTSKKAVAHNKNLPSIKEFLSMLLTFILVSFSYIFFRAENLTYAFNYINKIFSVSFFNFPKLNYLLTSPLTMSIELIIFLILFILIIEWMGRREAHSLERLFIKNSKFRKAFYMLIVILIFVFGNFEANLEFIYFQF